MAGYIRQSTFVDGDTITAALFNNEYNQLVNAFSNTSGHKHDGTTAEGPVIGLIGDAGETSPNNKVLIDTTNNYIEFYVEVSSAPVQQLYIADGAIIPVTDSDIDLGTTSLRFKDTYTDTVTTTGNVSIGGDLTVTGSATISGNLTFGDADTDSINLAAEIDSDIIPNTDGTYDLGSATKEWQDLYIDGTANIDSLVADTADINGGTIDGATIATSDITVGAGKTLNVSAGTLTLADNQISGDKVEGGTIAATTITTLTSTTGNITNVNATTVDSTNLEVTNLKAKDGTAAGSIADSTGVVTLGSSVLTTTDINGGTIDGSTIATSDITVGTGKTLDVSSGTLTLADNQISGDKVEGGTIAATTITDLTFGSLNDGTITVTAFADEDDMSSDSATLVPTQQSVKAYVDSQVTAQDLDFQGDTGGALSIDLDSESLTIAGGTGLDTVGSGNTVTVNIDSTVATLTGTQTLTNKTLTSPDINTPDIDGGTIDGTVIGGATPAAGTFTTLTANTSIAGTLSTAAQPNITSVGTLTGLTTSGTVTATDLLIDTDVLVTDSTNDRVGINNASPATTLDVGGSIYFSGILRGTSDGSASVPSIQPGNDGDTGLFRPIANNIGFSTLGSERMRIDASGNVGIGTTSPEHALHVNGGTANTVAQFQSTDANAYIEFLDSDAGASGCFIGGAGDDFVVLPNASEKFRVTSAGNVGIGTDNPAESLHTTGNIRFGDTAPAELYTNSSELRLGVDRNNDNDTSNITFYTNNDEKVRIDASGNVGIGTDIFTNSYKTYIEGLDQDTANLTDSGNHGATLYLRATANAVGSGGAVAFGTTFGNKTPFAAIKGHVLDGATNTKGDLCFSTRASTSATALTEAMRIDSSGNVLVGTTNTDPANTSSTTGLAVGSIGYMSLSRAGTALLLNRTSSAGDGEIVSLRKSGSTVGSIDTIASTLHIGTSNCRLRFNSTAADIRPCYSTGLNYDAAIDLGDSGARFKDLYLSSSLYQGGARIVRKFIGNGGGSGIFPSLENSPQSGFLHVTENGTTNYAIYALFKQDNSTGVVTTLIANSGITVSATNAGGTIATTGFSVNVNVRMITTIIRED